ncbi:MAG: hypothetical protein ACREDV_09935 [Methylocella sp.]
MPDNTWTPAWTGIGGMFLGVIATIIVALINRQPPMAALVDARIKLLIGEYEKRIAHLQAEIAELRRELDAVRRTRGPDTGAP